MKIQNVQEVTPGQHPSIITQVGMVTRHRRDGSGSFEALEVVFQPKANEGEPPFNTVSKLYSPVMNPLSGLGKLAVACGVVDFDSQDGDDFDEAALYGKECLVTYEHNADGFATVADVRKLA